MSALLPQADMLAAFHDECLAAEGWAQQPARHPAPGLWHWIEANHRCNTLLWEEEDQARRRDAPAAAIAQNKRRIDGYNQRRNDAVEAIDECLLSRLAPVVPAPSARLSSETAGAMIDRLSILALKIHHMGLQACRRDAAAEHRRACAQKHARLVEQRADLGACLDRLLAEAVRGESYFKLYRQFKMYNDPSLNPYLYGAGGMKAAS